MKNLFDDINKLVKNDELADEITLIAKKHLLIELNRIQNERNNKG